MHYNSMRVHLITSLPLYASLSVETSSPTPINDLSPILILSVPIFNTHHQELAFLQHFVPIVKFSYSCSTASAFNLSMTSASPIESTYRIHLPTFIFQTPTLLSLYVTYKILPSFATSFIPLWRLQSPVILNYLFLTHCRRAQFHNPPCTRPCTSILFIFSILSLNPLSPPPASFQYSSTTVLYVYSSVHLAVSLPLSSINVHSRPLTFFLII
jgi:hypothetical protein